MSILPEIQDPVDYVTLKREPFEMEMVTIVLQDNRRFDIQWKNKDLFLTLHHLAIPPLAFDALFNFNEVRFYPEFPGYPNGKIDIQ